MPYNSVSELPPNVKAKLKGKRRRQWMHVFNSEYKEHGDESRAFASAWSTAQKVNGNVEAANANDSQYWKVEEHRKDDSTSSRAAKASSSGNSEKISKDEAEYIANGKSELCKNCTMFVSPDSCTLVKGIISPSGHCKHFEAKAMKKSAASDNLNFFMPIEKIDMKKQMVYGYASTECEDSDGERISLDAIKGALPDYMKWANVREMHKLSAVGTTQEANIDRKGLYIGAHISDPNCWQKCVDKVYKGFSIGGRKLEKQKNLITKLNMTEISVVDRPANPECDFSIAKMNKDEKWEFAPGVELRKVKVKNKPVENDPNDDANEDNPSESSVPAETSGKNKDNQETPDPLGKREYSREVRDKDAESGIALPDGSYPIPDKGALGDAISAFGRAKDKGKAKAHIKRRAAALGATSMLPEKWGKKEARKLAKAAFRRAQAERLIEEVSPLAKSESAPPAFLTLKGVAGSETDASHDALLSLTKVDSSLKKVGKLKKRMATAGSLAYCFDSIRGAQRSLMLEGKAEGGDGKDMKLAKQLGSAAQILATVIGQKATHEGEEALSLTDVDDQWVVDSLGEDFEMAELTENLSKLASETDDPIAKAMAGMLAKASAPSRAMRMKSASSNMKKVREARKEACKAIKAAHSMMKAAYIAKMEKAAKPKDKEKDDDGDFDFGKAMSELSKAYSELGKVSTFAKAASMQLKKMAGRSGQKEQEPSHGNSFYQVPPSVVKDLSPGDLATASPGGEGRGSEPPLQALDRNWANKAAKNGTLPVEVVDLLVKNAKLESENELLARSALPTRGGARPYAFDLTKVIGNGTSGGDPLMKAVKDSGVNINRLADDESARGSVIGHFLLNKANSKSVFDPSFKGGVVKS